MEDAIIHDAPGDRIVIELYAWIVTDHRTGLEGLFGIMGPGGADMQAITSSPAVAKKIGQMIRSLPFAGKTFRLIKFKRGEVIESFKQ
jgi:hypothetical protein